MSDIHQKLLEQKLLRATRARRRFKAAVRHVIYNMYWIDADDDVVDTEDENELQATYRLIRMHRRPAKGLTIKEKAVLRKHTDYRTEEEISYLNKFIGGLKCFRPYPENVQLELVGVTYFEYYGPGRVLIRQNDEGHAMYFILTGEVAVSKTQWDEVTKCYVEEHVDIVTAGNTFGEIALLHNVPRTATCTTTAHCELLVLKKDDFDRVLKVSLMERWEAIRDAMKKFVYFNHWNDLHIRECCLVSRIKSYSVNQVVYGDKQVNKQNPGMHYFIVQGRCSVVEHMYIEESEKCGKKYYRYLEPPDNVVPEETISKLLNGNAEVQIPDSSVEQQNHEINKSKSKVLSKTRVTNSISKPRGSKKPSQPRISFKHKSSTNLSKTEIPETDAESSSTANSEEQQVQTLLRQLSDKLRHESSTANDLKISHDTINSLISEEADANVQSENILQCQNQLHKERRITEKLLQIPRSRIPSTFKLVFVQICTLEEKASFPEGNLMKHRRVIALNPVKVLLIPSYWLIQHNRANVWTRIERLLHQRIPPSEEVFKAYVENKKWVEYKKKLKDEILSNRKAYNKTSIHDVPYSIRIMSKYN